MVYYYSFNLTSNSVYIQTLWTRFPEIPLYRNFVSLRFISFCLFSVTTHLELEWERSELGVEVTKLLLFRLMGGIIILPPVGGSSFIPLELVLGSTGLGSSTDYRFCVLRHSISTFNCILLTMSTFALCLFWF